MTVQQANSCKHASLVIQVMAELLQKYLNFRKTLIDKVPFHMYNKSVCEMNHRRYSTNILHRSRYVSEFI